ncbi:MAG: hypothetical protein ACI867_000778 [Glaciecola sp.]|jgi:hypothetical protein
MKPVLQAAPDRRLGDDVMRHLEEDGLVIVEGFLDEDEVAASREHIATFLPTIDDYVAAPERWDVVGSSLRTHFTLNQFPTFPAELHLQALRPELVDFARRFNGCDDVLLTQSIISAKYSGHHDEDQDLHTDYSNHSLAWVPKRYLAGMIYYTDVTPDNGPTHAVSQRYSRDTPLFPRFRPRTQDPELYEHEVPLTAPAGSLLLYTMFTFHRGSRIIGAHEHRFNHHFCFQPAGVQWSGWSAWPQGGSDVEMSRLLTTCTVEQRTAMGFPAPEDEYWRDADNLDGVALRYPDMDLTPYRQAIEADASRA